VDNTQSTASAVVTIGPQALSEKEEEGILPWSNTLTKKIQVLDWSEDRYENVSR
jgi:hypothetical protein